ncbi:hypothetical protein JCM17823_25180 [Halorubrum gandharaense]
MHRRRFLARSALPAAALAVGVAGCIGDEPNGDGDADSDLGQPAADPVEEDPRVDEPPHEITVPEMDDDVEPDEYEEEWNESYLGDHMETEPSLAFESVPYWLNDPLRLDTEYGDQVFRVVLVEDGETLEAAFQFGELDAVERDRLDDIDFDERVVVIVQSGFGSGSISQVFARADAVDDGLHLHGYFEKPYIQTDDLTARASVLVVDRPEGGLDLARVSLTVDEATRVHFNSTEGVVEVE